MKYGGIIGPITFLLAVIIVAAIRGDYSHTEQLMSELGERGSAYSFLFNYAGFFVTGISVFLFCVFLSGELKSRDLSVAAAVLIVIHGLGMLAATWAQCDAGCPAEGGTSQLTHNIIAGIKFPALLLASLVLGVQAFKHRISNIYGTLCIIAFALSLGLMAKFTMVAETREFAGLWQRAFLAVIYGWLVFSAFFFICHSRERT